MSRYPLRSQNGRGSTPVPGLDSSEFFSSPDGSPSKGPIKDFKRTPPFRSWGSGFFLAGSIVSTPNQGADCVKVVVVGGPQVGKTSFIRAFCERHQPEEMYHENAVTVYPCKFTVNGIIKRAVIYEIPGDPAFGVDQRTPYYRDAHVFVWMYAVDDPLSFSRLLSERIPEAKNIFDWYTTPSVLVGNKRDLRLDPQVIERLARDHTTPVPFESALRWLHYEPTTHFYGISTHTSVEVNGLIDFVVNLALRLH